MHPVVKAHNDALAFDGAKRALEIVRLRSNNMTWAAIAREIGISEGAAKNVWTKQLQRFRDEATVGVEDHVDAQLLVWDGRLSRLQADLLEARDPNKNLPFTTRIALVSKIETAIARVEQMRIDLLGLKAPELHAHLHGGAGDGGVDIPMETLEAMGDDELAAQLEGQRSLRAVTVEATEAKAEEDEEQEYDGAPDEVVIEDPGPRAIAPTPEDEDADSDE